MAELEDLAAFAAVARAGGFREAARATGTSASRLSDALRRLETRLGVRLLHRTTRNVAPTEAGQELLVRLRPAFTDIEDALDKLSGLRDKPVGRVRLVTPRLAAMMVIAPKMKGFAQDYPDIVLDVTTDESPMDIVAGGYDAGIHFGEYIQKDMIAVRVSGDQRAAIVGAASYFKSNPMPQTPRDLPSHRCINYRHGAGGEVYRWEFEKGKKELSVAVNGPLIVDDVELLVRAALDGLGLAFMSEELAALHLAKGTLVRVLEDWCQPFPGFFLYYPSRRNQAAALAALIDTLRISR